MVNQHLYYFNILYHNSDQSQFTVHAPQVGLAAVAVAFVAALVMMLGAAAATKVAAVVVVVLGTWWWGGSTGSGVFTEN